MPRSIGAMRDPDPPAGREWAARPSRIEAFVQWVTGPLRRMWSSEDALDDYGLVHLASVAGDTLLAIALADSIFFSLPADRARAEVVLYLALTMAPLAVAGSLLVPVLDRSPYRRALSFGASAGRIAAVLLAARWVDSLLLFPATFMVLVLSKMHTVAKNGFTVAYAPTHRGLVACNAFLGRVAVAGFALAAVPGVIILTLGSARGVLFLAAVVYGIATILNLRLLPVEAPSADAEAPVVHRRGRMQELAIAAVGNGGLRAAQGYLLTLLAFALRSEDKPTYWFGVLIVTGTAGAAIGDWVATRLSRRAREELVVIGSVVAAGVAALFAAQTFTLFTLAVFTFLVGMGTEFGRLAFGSLMQGFAPGGAQGRVFVRYEVAFQLAWVTGAFIPAVSGIPFRAGIWVLSGFYLALGVPYLSRVLPPRSSRPRAPG